MNRRQGAALLAGLAAVLALFGGAAWWFAPKHPAGVVGTWTAGPGVTVTFGPDGEVALDGEGAAPPFLSGLAHMGRWDVSGGKMVLHAELPSGGQARYDYSYSFEEDGRVLRIGAYRFARR
jgi:hypothetical protein